MYLTSIITQSKFIQCSYENAINWDNTYLFYSYRAHNVNTLLDLRGCTFAYSDEESLSSSKIVLKTLKQKGENASFFGSLLSINIIVLLKNFQHIYACFNFILIVGSGSHLASAQMVLSKRAEWAAVDSTTLLYAKNFLEEGGKDIITLVTLGRLPPYPIVINSRISGTSPKAF